LPKDTRPMGKRVKIKTKVSDLIKMMPVKIILFALAGALFAGVYVHLNMEPVAVSSLVPVSSVEGAVPQPSAVGSPDNPEELGAVHWLRELAVGKAQAKASGKPLLILFQEVPGCSNCTRYGNSTLSHPLIVEAIESLFIPVCIYNNKSGQDAAALKRFGEAAWNNPVVRIVCDDDRDVVPRLADFGSSYQLVNGMRRALEASGTAVPPYMELLEAELMARESGLETATFSMYCFWSGEGTFGAIPGVIETAPGFQNGKEVVQVTFNPAVVQKAALEERTHPKGITACSKNEGFRSDKEPKYYLAQTDYRFVPMTTLQACRANSLAGNSKKPDEVLSPRQLALVKKIREQPEKKWKNMIGRNDLAKAWGETGGASNK